MPKTIFRPLTDPDGYKHPPQAGFSVRQNDGSTRSYELGVVHRNVPDQQATFLIDHKQFVVVPNDFDPVKGKPPAPAEPKPQHPKKEEPAADADAPPVVEEPTSAPTSISDERPQRSRQAATTGKGD